MLSTRLICLAVLLSFGSISVSSAATKSRKAVAKKVRPGKTETLACRLGTEDRHARIAVVLIGGKLDSFAYYSKWKPRTCSIYLQRDRDMYSKWADAGAMTTVSLEKGAFLVEHGKGEYHFVFREVDRERYCGMDGVINGSLTIRKGSEECKLGGDIMVEGTALGEAYAQKEQQKAAPGAQPETAAVSATPTAASPTAAASQTPAAASPTAAAPTPADAAPSASAVAEAQASVSTAVTDAPAAADTQAQPAEVQQAASADAPAQSAEPPKTVADAAEKSDEAPRNPLRALFKAITTPRNPDGTPKTEAVQ